jgi:ferredoxin
VRVRITVNRDLCAGHARCHATSPDLFELDDLGYVDLPGDSVVTDDEQAARRGVAACPERALSITETQD